jgi:hypothetical protein
MLGSVCIKSESTTTSSSGTGVYGDKCADSRYDEETNYSGPDIGEHTHHHIKGEVGVKSEEPLRQHNDEVAAFNGSHGHTHSRTRVHWRVVVLDQVPTYTPVDATDILDGSEMLLSPETTPKKSAVTHTSSASASIVGSSSKRRGGITIEKTIAATASESKTKRKLEAVLIEETTTVRACATSLAWPKH